MTRVLLGLLKNFMVPRLCKAQENPEDFLCPRNPKDF